MSQKKLFFSFSIKLLIVSLLLLSFSKPLKRTRNLSRKPLPHIQISQNSTFSGHQKPAVLSNLSYPFTYYLLFSVALVTFIFVLVSYYCLKEKKKGGQKTEFTDGDLSAENQIRIGENNIISNDNRVGNNISDNTEDKEENDDNMTGGISKEVKVIG